MVIRTCPECGTTFEAKGSWQRLCWDCWRQRENGKLEQAGYRRGYRDGWREGLDAGRQMGPSQQPRLDGELLRALVALCHPDRHPPERFELANRTTATLLGMLKEPIRS